MTEPVRLFPNVMEISNLMRNVVSEADPQRAWRLYSRTIAQNLQGSDRRLALSVKRLGESVRRPFETLIGGDLHFVLGDKRNSAEMHLIYLPDYVLPGQAGFERHFLRFDYLYNGGSADAIPCLQGFDFAWEAVRNVGRALNAYKSLQRPELAC